MSASIAREGLGLQEARHCPILNSMRRDSESEVLPMARFGTIASIMSPEKWDVDGELEAEI